MEEYVDIGGGVVDRGSEGEEEGGNMLGAVAISALTFLPPSVPPLAVVEADDGILCDPREWFSMPGLATSPADEGNSRQGQEGGRDRRKGRKRARR